MINYQKITIFATIMGIACIFFSFSMQYLPNCLNLTEQKQIWYENFFMAFGINLISSVLIIVLYDLAQEKMRINRQKKFLKTIKYELLNHIRLYSSMYKATVIKNKIPEEKLKDCSLERFFDDDFYENIGYLKLKDSAPRIPPISWGVHIARTIQGFNNSMDDFLTKYIDFLDDEIVNLLLFFINDKSLIEILELLCNPPKLKEFDNIRKENDLILAMTRNKEYDFYKTRINKLILLTGIYNSKSGEPPISALDNWMAENFAPQFGINRFRKN